MNKIVISIFTISLILLSSLLGHPVSSNSIQTTSTGNTIYVGGNGPGNYSSINCAIAAAIDGDIIFVYNGSYHGLFQVDKSISLIGEDKHNTILLGLNNVEKTLFLNADHINISNFTIKNTYSFSDSNIVINSNFSVISNNIINSKGYADAINLFNSKNNLIFNNEITGSVGISLANSSQNQIYNNIFSKNFQGISLRLESNNNIIFSNNFSNTTAYEIDIFTSSQNTIKNNYFFSNGIIINLYLKKSVYQKEISNNKIKGKPLLYIQNESNRVIDGTINYGQIIIVNCDNITVKNQNISSAGFGIQMVQCFNCHIIDNEISNTSRYGLILLNSIKNEICRNKIFKIDYCGIFLIDSSKNFVKNNDIFINSNGINLENSNENKIFENNISKCRFHGISMEESNKNIIDRNNIFDNEFRGISIVRKNYNNSISNNTISNNEASGIDLEEKNEHNIIIKNIISKNKIGILLCYSENNEITYNDFLLNKKDAKTIHYDTTWMKALKKCWTNKWEHNYWNKSRFLPKAIFGFNYYIPIWDGDPPAFFYIFITFDKRPAVKPNCDF